LLQAAVARQGYEKVEEGCGQEAEVGAGTPRLLTVREVAVILRVCTATVYSMVERGELQHVRVSNSIRVLLHADAKRAGSGQDQNNRANSPFGAGT
jgi:excisionase family DNA binding protein